MDDKALIEFSLSDKPWKIKDTWALDEASFNAISGIGGWAMYKSTDTNYQKLSPSEVKNTLLESAFLYQDWGVYNNVGHQALADEILNVSLSDNIRRSNITYSWYDEMDSTNCSTFLALN